MITNQKLKKSLEEIKNITSFDAILYSAKGKHLTGTVEEPEHSDIFVKEFIVSEEDVREKNDAIAFAVEIDSELEYVLVMFCQYTSENLVIGRMAVCQLRTLVLGESERYDRNNFIQNILMELACILKSHLNLYILTLSCKVNDIMQLFYIFI